MSRRVTVLHLWFVLGLLRPAAAGAQPIETIGVRALGMGGAFVAVADDGSAVYWNPAGLAGGPFFGVSLEQGALEAGRRDDEQGSSRSASLFTITAPPLGLSYARLRFTRAAAVDGSAGRQDSRSGSFRLDSLVTHQTGVTLLQSIAQGVTVGATLKFVRGVAAAGVAAAGDLDAALDAGADVIGRATNAFDLDVGVVAAQGPIRAGLVARNLREPGFAAPDGTRLTLERLARAGVAWTGDRLTIAVDLDLTRVADDTSASALDSAADRGRRRMLAAGAERRWGARLAVRGGFRVNTVDERAPVGALGASLMTRGSFWVDAQVTRGVRRGDRGWGLSGRLAF